MSESGAGYRPRAGDVVTVDGRRVGDSGRLGEILETCGAPGHVPLRIRWEDGRGSVLLPGAEGRIHAKGRRRPKPGVGS
jgi:hypothetical protein